MSSSIYNRNTELRNVHTKDLYSLAVILDDENYWQTLMEVIPQKINNQTFGTKEDLEKIATGASYERKYSNDHIRLVENAIRRPGESRLCSEILFDEWGSSGRKTERPTLGVLLHLLVQSKLYRAADFVAELLNEPKPSRPIGGPAAEFEFEIDVFKDIQEVVNDTRFYPNTEDLQDNVNNDINNDYYTKYKIINKKMPTANEDSTVTNPPKPPPRLLKSARLLKQQQKQVLQHRQSQQLPQQTANKNDPNSQNVEEYSNQYPQLDTLSNNENIPMLSLASSHNIPKLSALINTTDCNVKTTTMCNSTVSESLLPNLSALNNSSVNKSEIIDDEDDSLSSTPSLIYTKSNIVENSDEQHRDQNSLPIVVLSKPLNSNCKSEELDYDNIYTQDLPAISALNLNGERDNNGPHPQQPDEGDTVTNVPSVALNFIPHQSQIFDECPQNKTGDSNLPSLLENINYNCNSSKHQLDAIEEDYNGIEHEHDLDDDDGDSIPNLSFLENRSSNNESSLTSVTNTSGENSFDQSVNDCSSTSTDNVPFLSVLNQ